MNHDHTPKALQQPLPPMSHDPVADYLEFLEKISEDVDQIPDQKVDERARQIFGQSAQPNGLAVQGTRLDDVIGSGQPQQMGIGRLLRTIIKIINVLRGRPPELSDVVEIAAAAQREADRIRRTACQEALAEAAHLRAEAECDASALTDTALTRAADITTKAHRTAKGEAAHMHAGTERTAEAVMCSTRERIVLPRRPTANVLTAPANKVDADTSASLTKRGPEASRDARRLDEDAGAIVPAYLLTRSRTVPASEAIDLIAVITTTGALTPPVGLGPEQLIVLQKCTKPTQLVDLAVELNLPIGVVRVLVGDLHVQQLVQVENPPPAPDVNVLAKVISNLSAL
ncbi:DUF742 domain-containing protein [Nonomuraea sp. NPDC046802]|uniref:DUF742 domain-containing protein n=1 Tax=Nonomuraea sp. NPDC046802 TaxID=3154919 RepID=UPI00340E2F09